MFDINKIKFYRDIRDLGNVANYKVYLKEDVDSKEELFELYYQAFDFPYFGFNWNALLDCLKGLEWIDNNTVSIIHENVLRMSKKDMMVYCDVLCDVLSFWEKYEGEYKKVVEVWFPESSRSMIENVIADLEDGHQ